MQNDTPDRIQKTISSLGTWMNSLQCHYYLISHDTSDGHVPIFNCRKSGDTTPYPLTTWVTQTWKTGFRNESKGGGISRLLLHISIVTIGRGPI